MRIAVLPPLFPTLAILGAIAPCLLASPPALAASLPVPTLTAELTPAGTPVGQTISGTNVTVTGVTSSLGSATPQDLVALTGMQSLSELLGYTNTMGISMPMTMTGTETILTRSDGGALYIFQTQDANGNPIVFLGDWTSGNSYGVQIAKVGAGGAVSEFQAHGMNGTFTAPWWSPDPQDYWSKYASFQLPGSSALASRPLAVRTEAMFLRSEWRPNLQHLQGGGGACERMALGGS